MKRIIYALVRQFAQQPRFMRRLRIFAVVAIVGFVIASGLVIWASVAFVGSIATTAAQAVRSPVVEEQIHRLESEVNAVPRFRALVCWDKAQSFIGVRPWLERPIVDNLTRLKMACFEQVHPLCEGANCERMKDFMNTAEGRTI